MHAIDVPEVIANIMECSKLYVHEPLPPFLEPDFFYSDKHSVIVVHDDMNNNDECLGRFNANFGSERISPVAKFSLKSVFASGFVSSSASECSSSALVTNSSATESLSEKKSFLFNINVPEDAVSWIILDHSSLFELFLSNPDDHYKLERSAMQLVYEFEALVLRTLHRVGQTSIDINTKILMPNLPQLGNRRLHLTELFEFFQFTTI